jgi:hypothetical protein
MPAVGLGNAFTSFVPAHGHNFIGTSFLSLDQALLACHVTVALLLLQCPPT